MQNGLIPLATVLMLAATGCGQLGGVCEEDCAQEQGSAGTTGTGGTPATTPGVVPADVTAIPDGQRVVGYLPTWGSSLPSYATPAILSRLTHVAIAFANVTPSAVTFANGNDVRSFVAEARRYNVKVLVSIGGANGSDAVAELITPANLPTFVANTMKCVEDFQLDGVDVDIEGGAVNQDYEPLVVALSNELKPRGLTLSSAVGNWFADSITPTALGLFDFVQVMAYDACGSWTDACPHSSLDLATSQIAFWVEQRGVPADRMVLGVPFYARSWGANAHDIVPYSEILGLFPDAWQTDWIDSGGTQYSYNGHATIQSKVEIGKAHGGMMIWDLISDEIDPGTRDLGSHSLLRVLNDSY